MREPAPNGLPELYARELAARSWHSDAAQVTAVEHLERLSVELSAQHSQLGVLRQLQRRLWPRGCSVEKACSYSSKIFSLTEREY